MVKHVEFFDARKCWTKYAYDVANQIETVTDASGPRPIRLMLMAISVLFSTQYATGPPGLGIMKNQPTLVRIPTGARVTMAYNANFRRRRKEN
jgi:hypothetical protein